MSQKSRISNKFQYFVEDCNCAVCWYWVGTNRGCTLAKCCCAEIRRDALAHGRIKRTPGSMKWNLYYSSINY